LSRFVSHIRVLERGHVVRCAELRHREALRGHKGRARIGWEGGRLRSVVATTRGIVGA
jgi:hypothetical protein